ncbi:MAG: hypothetical protein AAF975_07570, partial [Spirochaetota bacterium]
MALPKIDIEINTVRGKDDLPQVLSEVSQAQNRQAENRQAESQQLASLSQNERNTLGNDYQKQARVDTSAANAIAYQNYLHEVNPAGTTQDFKDYKKAEAARYKEEQRQAKEAQKLETERFHKEQQQIKKRERDAQNRRSWAANAGTRFGRGATALAGMGGDPLGSSASLLGMAGQGARTLGGMAGGGAAGAILGGIGIAGLGTAGVIMGGNALSKTYEQFSSFTENVQLSGRPPKSSGEATERFNAALDNATVTAIRFGVAIEEAGQIQRTAMRITDTVNGDGAKRISDMALRYKNAFGVDTGSVLELEGLGMRYSGAEGFATTGIAAHKVLEQEGKQTNATLTETMQAMNTLARSVVDKGIGPDDDSAAQALLMLTDMQLTGGKNYTSRQAAQMVGRIDSGFANAAGGGKDTDIFALQAAMSLDGGYGTLQQARERLEAGMTGDPRLLTETLKRITTTLDGNSSINTVKKMFNMNYTQSNDLLETYEKWKEAPDSEKSGMLETMKKQVKAAEGSLNPLQDIAGETQTIRRSLSGLGENFTDYKKNILGMLGNTEMGRKWKAQIALEKGLRDNKDVSDA